MKNAKMPHQIKLHPIKLHRIMLAFCLSLSLLPGCGGTPPVPERYPLPVTIGEVSDRKEATALRYMGTIEPGATVFVAFRTGGYVKDILRIRGNDGTDRFVQAGDRVASGTVLAQVEDREYRSQVGRAMAGVQEARSGLLSSEAQVSAAKNSAEQARDEFERAKRLFASESITRVEYDTARTRSRNADEALAAARAMARGIEARIRGAEGIVREISSVTGDTAVRAPLDGFVVARMIEPGGLVGPGTVAFVVARLDPVKLRFSLPDRFLPKAPPGARLAASLDFRPGRSFAGTVSKVALAADPKTRLFDVELTIPNPEGELKPGMVGRIDLDDDPEGGKCLIPLEAIVQSGDGEGEGGEGFAVFLAEGREGKTVARRREIKLGKPVGNTISVESGISPGERVVLSGAAFLQDGDPIHIVKDSF